MKLLDWFPHRKPRYKDLDEEVQSHLRMAIEDRIVQGESAEEARASAAREFGNEVLVKEVTRQMWGFVWLDHLMHDLRYGARMLFKAPAFSLIAILTLAIGIGANTAIFSVVNAVILKPLPYAHPGRLVGIFQAKLKDGVNASGCSYEDYQDWREQSTVFSEMGGFASHELTLTGRGDPYVVRTLSVTPEFLPLLGAAPLAGRMFPPAEGKVGAQAVVLLSENIWMSRFGADPKIIGATVNLDMRPFTIIGVMPASFRFPLFATEPDIWIPLGQDPLFSPWMKKRVIHWLGGVARLKPGVTLAQAQSELDGINSRLAKQYPADDDGWTVRVVPLRQQIVGSVKSALWVLLGAAGLVLLIACANIANLLVSRAASRSQEMAIRRALGAARGRVIRQLLTESAVLGLAGGGAGVLLAYWGVQGLSSALPQGLPRIHPIQVDGWVLCFALGLSFSASLIFGLAPALFAADSKLESGLREGSARGGESRGRGRVRRLLAAAEIALAMILLVAAGLLARSFLALTAVNPGFDFQNILKAEISLPRYQYSSPQQWVTFSNRFLEGIKAQPGMQDTAIAVPLPLADVNISFVFSIVGNPPLPPGIPSTAGFASVSPDYFRVMGIPLMRGRYFTIRDVDSAPRMAIISETMARRYFPNQDPLGRRVAFGFPPNGKVEREIVGVVGDVRNVSLNQAPGPMIYLPFAQEPFWGGGVVVKSRLEPASVAAAMRREVGSIDQDLPVTDVATMPVAIQATVEQPRFRTMLLGLFGAMALALAAIGIFGVVSHSVSCRTHEIGIRMALGATRENVLALILRETARPVLLGLAVGIPSAFVLARIISGFLFGVPPGDPLTFACVAIMLALAAFVASAIPARRAARVDPMVALRHE